MFRRADAAAGNERRNPGEQPVSDSPQTHGQHSAGAHSARRALTAWQHAQILLRHYSRYARLMRLHRPIGIWLLLWPTLWAVWIAGAGRPGQQIFLIMVLGTLVVRSAGCVINDFADRKIDPHVERTADRPLATGEVAPAEAVMLFAALMLIALGLVLTLNRFTVMLAIGGAAITVLYPFTKRFFSAPQFVLGIAFAWGVPMAFAATSGEVPRVGWLLFLAAVVWVIVYDTQYAMADRDDDLKIGVRSTAILFGDLDRAFIGALQLLLLAALILVGRSAALGAWYAGGLAVAVAFGLYQQWLIRDRESGPCFRAFLNNAWLGGAVFCGILLDYLFAS
jgi:4-hydroxybenzoate polyprenyltransferase